MKNPDRHRVAKLDELPNIGSSIRSDLELIGITHPRQLVGRDPFELYQQLSARKGQRQDPCVLDTFMAAVDFMEGAEARPWWKYTQQRKKRLAEGFWKRR